MGRQWGPSGVGPYKDVKISDAARDQILLTLKNHKIVLNESESFFSALDDAASIYHSCKEFKEESKPSVVRNNLKAAYKAAHDLWEKTIALDHNSMLLIREVEYDGVEKLRDSIKNTLSLLRLAEIKAREYPSRGGLIEYEKHNLARFVGCAIQEHLRVKVTATKEGLFEACVSIVLEDVTGSAVSNIHTLIETVVKDLKSNP